MKLHTSNSIKLCSSLLAGLLTLSLVPATGCQEKSVAAATVAPQQTFFTPEEAGQALHAAAQAGDENAMKQVLGSESQAILSSGDQEEDKAALESFVAKYERMNRWVTMADGSRILYIGADNYAYPIPLARNASSKWYFNTAAGEDEILARRIGKNELLAIDAISAMANAEQLYFKHKHDGEKAHRYTQKIFSTPGKNDGLYWEVPDDQPSSPLGRLNEFASDVVVSTQPGDAPVFDGYCFRVLTAQGNEAKGGAKSYPVDGEMTHGFAILATPVTYADSGIMTFLVSRDGVAYQKDLGPNNTTDIATDIYAYNPDTGWAPAE